jgi:hypothetical protein
LLAYGVLSKDSKQWDVHFHLEDGLCEGKALPSLWDNGAYFDSGCLIGGKLRLFAHFQKKDIGSQVLATSTTSTALSAGRPNIERPISNLKHPIPPSASHQTGRLTSALETPVKQVRLDISIPQNEKHTSGHEFPDSESYGSDETHSPHSPSDEGDEVNQRLRLEETQQEFLANAKATQYAIDFDAALLSNAPTGTYGHLGNWDDTIKEHKAKIAHAKLINGSYGLPAPASCERCATKGLVCRIYRPDLRAARVTSGACGECRLRGNTCVMNGHLHGNSPANKRTSDIAFESPSSKILRRNIGDECASNLDYCPIVTCPRRKEPFFSKANFLRHIRSAHFTCSPGRHGADRTLDAYCSQCRDRNAKYEMLPNPSARITMPMEGTSETQRDDGVEANTAMVTIKQEANKSADGPVDPDDYTYDDDSVTYGQDPKSPSYEIEDDSPNGKTATHFEDNADENGLLAESAFHHYSNKRK